MKALRNPKQILLDRRHLPEQAARLLVLLIILGLPAAVLSARWLSGTSQGNRVIEVHARMPEQGGWAPADLQATVGEPLHLRLISDDVVHSFAIGQSDRQAIEVKPGEPEEVTLTFNQAGKYTFYCTRWCGANHWRMRGTIEVRPAGPPAAQSEPVDSGQPLYVTLGLDLDAPHPATAIPERKPSAALGAEPGVDLPAVYLESGFYRRHSPVEIWRILRADPFTQALPDAQVWDLVALIWKLNTTPEALAESKGLYEQNCAACHGEAGAGDGVMAPLLKEGTAPAEHGDMTSGHNTETPTDFSDPVQMLGASPALLEGKILRGGMGTGMPYWGPIFTGDQVRALADYLFLFQFDMGQDYDP